MTTVFISGSRKISRLNKEIKDRLKNLIIQEFEVVVGDANGADKAVQQFLLDESYPHVTVFCSGNACRNNLGNWKVSKIEVDPKLRGRAFYTKKDKEMAEIADYGFVLWDGKSPGSYSNIMELLKRNKKALVYYLPEKSFLTVSRLDDANGLLRKCDTVSQGEIRKKIKLPSLVKEIECMAQGALSF
uniref:Uncharacterized protein n=1 Tax=Candidatus Kentrum sp. SD TaxID=2126332 RepID=A0A450YFG8_9GAMM|nr:MAG: hypothetical protein BECKSD772F_GA0070984_105716 [Candidatus Kentron sp. SD]VFK44416.1 MAG: hypothetical protein BECKSD772E_GA0070983_103726 [Candidatus Kentron sp. SD]